MTGKPRDPCSIIAQVGENSFHQVWVLTVLTFSLTSRDPSVRLLASVVTNPGDRGRVLSSAN